MSHYDEAMEQLESATDASIGTPLEAYHLGKAQVLATLALVDAQREATAWGKEQVISARKEQTEFIAEIRHALDEED